MVKSHCCQHHHFDLFLVKGNWKTRILLWKKTEEAYIYVNHLILCDQWNSLAIKPSWSLEVFQFSYFNRLRLEPQKTQWRRIYLQLILYFCMQQHVPDTQFFVLSLGHCTRKPLTTLECSLMGGPIYNLVDRFIQTHSFTQMPIKQQCLLIQRVELSSLVVFELPRVELNNFELTSFCKIS